MKQRYLCAVFLVIIAVCPSGIGQTAEDSSPRIPGAVNRGPYTSLKVGISPLKQTIKRRGKNVPQDKKSFVVIDPIVIVGGNRLLSKKIEGLLDYERVFEVKIDEQVKDDNWLDEASYKVNYNNYGILDVTLTISGSAAYPSMANRTVVISLQTGKQLKAQDIFDPTKFTQLVAAVRVVQQAGIKTALAQLAKDSPDEVANVKEMLEGKDFSEEHLNHFSVSDKGVTFIYDYGFPHVALALEPDRELFLLYTTLKPFIKRDGLLARFIR